MKKNQRSKPQPKKDVPPANETIQERVHRHISDINSEITDDDIKNVRTGLEIRSEALPENELEGEDLKSGEDDTEARKNEDNADIEDKQPRSGNH